MSNKSQIYANLTKNISARRYARHVLMHKNYVSRCMKKLIKEVN